MEVKISSFDLFCICIMSFVSYILDMDLLWSCQNPCDALSYLLDNIYIR